MCFRWLNITRNSRIILAIVFFVTVSGCVHHHPLNLTIAKERVEKYHSCGQYDKDLDNVVHCALKHFKNISPCNNATVVFDIDDTILSGYCNEKSISFGYIPKLSHEWILRADAPAIQQTKHLYDYLVGRGFHIIFLTGRKHDEYDATIKNLNAQGFTHFDKLIVREQYEQNLTAKAYKSARRKQLTKEGYRIVGDVGDQWSDLEGGYSGYKIKIPNYRYTIA